MLQVKSRLNVSFTDSPLFPLAIGVTLILIFKLLDLEAKNLFLILQEKAILDQLKSC